MVSVCLPSDALLQHLPSYLGFSFGHGVSLHSRSSKAQLLLLTLDEGYLLTAAVPDLQCGSSRPSCACAATLGMLLPNAGPGFPHGWLLPLPPPPQARGGSSGSPPLALGGRWLLLAATPDLGRGVAPLGHCPWPWAWGSSSQPLPLTSDAGCLLPAAPDLRCGVAPLSHSCAMAA